MDMIEAFQEYFFKAKTAKANGVDSSVENGSLHRCSTHSYCCCSRKRDCSTSTYDLGTYIWHTEGDGVGINSSIRGDEDDCCSCRTGSCGQKGRSFGARSQSKCCEMAQGNLCDASTSTFDLSTFVWGTDGASGLDKDVEDDDFAHDLGDRDIAGRSREGGDRKRPRSDAFLGFITNRKNSGLAVVPRKKKRRI